MSFRPAAGALAGALILALAPTPADAQRRYYTACEAFVCHALTEYRDGPGWSWPGGLYGLWFGGQTTLTAEAGPHPYRFFVSPIFEEPVPREWAYMFGGATGVVQVGFSGSGWTLPAQMIADSRGDTPGPRILALETLIVQIAGPGTGTEYRFRTPLVEVVPEPATVALTAAGVLVLAGVARRRI
jgi:hypothetical protein